MKIRISRKEAKESAYWLSLLDTSAEQSVEEEGKRLQQEATELRKIFGAILTKSLAKEKEA